VFFKSHLQYRGHVKYTLLLLPTVICCPHAQVGLGLTPMRLELNLKPGAVHSGGLNLSNEAGTPVRVRGELLDFNIDETSTPQFLRQIPSEAANSCREWLSANPMETELDQSQHSIVRYTIRVPQTATPRSYHCAIGYTTMPSAEQLKQTGLRNAIRIIAAIYIIIGKPAIEGDVSGLVYEPVPGSKVGQWRAVLSIQNRGGYFFRPSGTIELISASGATLETIDLVSLPALPHREQRYIVPVTYSNPADVKKLRARVDLGSHEVQEASIDVAPPLAVR